MKISNSAKHVIGVSATVALLAGCTSSGGPSLAPTGNSMTSGAVHQEISSNSKADLSLTRVTPFSVKPNFHKVPNVKVIEPNCCALTKTLFVTDGYGGPSFLGSVFVFSFPAGALLGTLPAPPEGWSGPQGACLDQNGNVYFANTEMSTIDEYSHNGVFIQALSDHGQFPVGCAFDRSTGNLAVSNIIDMSGGPGGISIYRGGVLQNTFSVPNMERVYFIGYQAKTGILWLGGSDSSGFFQYDSFRGGTFANVGVHGATIGFPGTVQWSAKTQRMNVGDQDTFTAPTLYQVDDRGNVVGSTVTQCEQSSDFCDIAQGFIKGPRLAAPDGINLSADLFPYPAGGSPEVVISGMFEQPLGAVVSPDKGSGD